MKLPVAKPAQPQVSAKPADSDESMFLPVSRLGRAFRWYRIATFLAVLCNRFTRLGKLLTCRDDLDRLRALCPRANPNQGIKRVQARAYLSLARSVLSSARKF